jgi:hypothetical protein
MGNVVRINQFAGGVEIDAETNVPFAMATNYLILVLE